MLLIKKHTNATVLHIDVSIIILQINKCERQSTAIVTDTDCKSHHIKNSQKLLNYVTC